MNINFLKNFKFSSMFLKFFLSFFILIIIPVVVSNVNAYLNTRSILKDEAIRSHTLLMGNISDAMEQRLNDLHNSVLELTNHKDVSIICFGNTINIDNVLSISNLSKEIDSLRLTHGIVENIFIYFKNIDRVYYGGTYDRELFFQDYFEGLDEDVWSRVFNFGIQNNTSLVKNSDVTVTKRPVILFSMPQYYIEGVKPKIQVIITLKKEEVLKYIRDNPDASESKMLILSKDGDILFASDPVFENFETEKLSEGINSQEGTIVRDGQKFFVSSVKGKNGLEYLSLIPTKIIFSKADYVRNLIFVNLILFFIVGIILAYLFSNWMYKPIKNVVSFIDGNKDKDDNKLNGEFGYIKMHLKDLFKENSSLKLQMNEDVVIIKERFAYQLLNGLINNKEDFHKWSKSSSMIDFNGSFCVISASFEPNGVSNENEYLLFKSVCINEIKNFIITPSDMILTQINEKVVSIIVHLEAEDKEGVINKLIEAVVELSKVSKEYLRIFIGVGNTINGALGIKVSYKQAIKALDYRKTGQHHYNVIYYRDVVKEKHIVYYPIDKENIIINSLIAGNYEVSVKTFESILQYNLNNILPYVLISKLFTEFSGTLQRVISKMNIAGLELMANETPLLIDLKDYDDYEQCTQQLYSICSQICKVINQNTVAEEKMNKIKKYIDENIHEDIYLELLFLQFDISPSYLSKNFKETFGINFLDYINQERIRRTKELLTNTRSDIQEIAISVGFKSGNTLARTFKKYEGISPTQYRSLTINNEI